MGPPPRCAAVRRAAGRWWRPWGTGWSSSVGGSCCARPRRTAPSPRSRCSRTAPSSTPAPTSGRPWPRRRSASWGSSGRPSRWAGSLFTVTGCRTGIGLRGPARAPRVRRGGRPLARARPAARDADVVRRPRPRRGPAGGAPGVGRAGSAAPTWSSTPAPGPGTRLPADPLPEVYDRFAVARRRRPRPRGLADGRPGRRRGARHQAAGPARPGDRDVDAAAGRPGPRLPAVGGRGRAAPQRSLPPGRGSSTRRPGAGGRDRPLDGRRGVDLYGVVDGDRSTYELYSVGSLGSDGRARLYDVGSGDLLTVAAPPGREEAYDDTSTAVGSSLFVFGGQQWAGSREGTLLRDAWLWTPPEG